MKARRPNPVDAANAESIRKAMRSEFGREPTTDEVNEKVARAARMVAESWRLLAERDPDDHIAVIMAGARYPHAAIQAVAAIAADAVKTSKRLQAKRASKKHAEKVAMSKAKREKRNKRIRKLRAAGLNTKKIAAQVKLAESTVRRICALN